MAIDFQRVVLASEPNPGFKHVVVENPIPLVVAAGGTGGVTGADAQRLLSGVYVLAASAAALTLTGTLAATTLATVTIPAGLMGANGFVRVTQLWNHTNSANNKTMSVRFGGSLIQNTTVTTQLNSRLQTMVANRNSLSAQVAQPTGLGSGGWGSTTGSLITLAIDTSAAVDLTLIGTLANTGETLELEYFLVELMAGQGS